MRSERQRKNRRQPPDHTPLSTSARPARWLKAATLLLTGICLLGLFSTEIADTDFWWHLKTGQYIVEHHSLPVPDPFAYTSFGRGRLPGRRAGAALQPDP